MKLWEKGIETDNNIELFTIGNDQIFDLTLAKYDVLTNIAHANMLYKIGHLTETEKIKIVDVLHDIQKDIEVGAFRIDDKVEDIHSQIENILTLRLGDIGKKIHCGRSRNDQVATDLRLYYRDVIKTIASKANIIIEKLISKSEEFKNILIPGYTHFQVAMPSSFGLWFSSYAESFVDDLILLSSVFKVVNQNPLGTAAGYGSSIPIDRKYTSSQLGFDNLIVNSSYAQMSRGKTDLFFSFSITAIATTISKMSYDIVLYLSENFKFITLPSKYSTGSSIMPHKKNPDVFELLRANCNKLTTLPVQINSIYNNLPSGYHRDFQLAKDMIFRSIKELITILDMFEYVIDKIVPVKTIFDDKNYKYIFSVEEVNKLVINGTPFREAYKIIADQIKNKKFHYDSELNHKHIGSINNLSNNEILKKKKGLLDSLST